MPPLRSGLALGATALIALLSTVSVAVKLPPPARLSFSPGYRGLERCPQRCSLAGPHPGNWSLYHNLYQTDDCGETMFMGFSLYDAVDDASTYHRIFACTSYGADWANCDEPSSEDASSSGEQRNGSSADIPATPVTYQLGWDRGKGGRNGLSTADIRSMSRQLREYLNGGFRPLNETVIMLAKSNQGTLGMYMGRGLHNSRTGQPALKILESALQQLNASNSVALQLCNDDSEHIFGVMALSDGTFGAVSNALQTWSNGSCLTMFAGGSVNYTSEAVYLTPPFQLLASNLTNTTGADANTTHAIARHARRQLSNLGETPHIGHRDQCRTIEVDNNDTCEKLAQKCGIKPSDFTQYNSDSKLCSTLMKGMHVCCSAGQKPSFRPPTNADGSCAAHLVDHGETCASLAASYDLSIQDINNFNRDTWAFNGCNNFLMYQAVICLSEGDPPMPPAVTGAQCGPQVPGTPKQPASVYLNNVNPCPINACCDIWGSCGTTSEYCTNTSISAAPGSAAPNTNGCISNCGTELIRSPAPAEFLSIGYYEGYQFDRPCLYQDPSQIDTTKFTHIHYAFATINADYTLSTGTGMNLYTFSAFRRLRGIKRIVSFGGWGFSTSPNTYDIFRQGVKEGNREKLADNIAQFVQGNDLDGVDFDWEYPGAYDIPGIPPPVEGKDEGPNYLEFLKLVRQRLPNKSISIAVSSSYWYLRNFPIAEMSSVVDYIVYMTYDLHGQWDASTKWSQSGCDTGTCLRSHVNLTETMSSLVMVTKAGVPSNKIIVGVSSYGRSFNMADGNCWSNMCTFTGTATHSDAKPGVCTGVGGYIADAEIKEILSNPSRVKQHYLDSTSDSNILVYDENQWVSYMDSSVRNERTQRYKQLNMGGTANWAIDLENYTQTSPYENIPWDAFILAVKANAGTYPDGYFTPRNGNWTSLDCTNSLVTQYSCFTPEEQWNRLDAADAWNDSVTSWRRSNTALGVFSQSLANIYHLPVAARCYSMDADTNCDATTECVFGDESGAAAYLIWNSIVLIHEMYKNYHAALMGDTYNAVMNSMKAFENTFAPVPPAKSDAWVDILMSIVTLGVTAVASPFFNIVFKELDYFIEHDAYLEILKDTTYAAIASTATIAGTTIKGNEPDGTWTASDQDSFSEYIGQSITAWGNATAATLFELMSGNKTSIDRLTDLIADGKMIPGATHEVTLCTQSEPAAQPPVFGGDSTNSLTASTKKMIFASAIPSLWSLSGLRPFVLDTGSPCATVDPLPNYMSPDTMHGTAGCYQDRLYYLVMPEGDAVYCDQDLCNLGTCSAGDCHNSLFVAPTGIESLVPGNDWGDLTRQDLIVGSVRTYQQNHNTNAGGPADTSNSGTMNDLLDGDFTTPGVIRLPVCTPDLAFKAWELKLSPNTPNYPCSPPPTTVSKCGDSTFVDTTSNASPPVSDCLHIIKNIEGTDGDYPIHSSQKGILQYGLCIFGIEGPGGRIANQDAIDLIHDSVAKFGGSGKIGAKGTMDCGSGTVTWGIYHSE